MRSCPDTDIDPLGVGKADLQSWLHVNSSGNKSGQTLPAVNLSRKPIYMVKARSPSQWNFPL